MSFIDDLDEFTKNVHELEITLFNEEDINLGEKIGKGATGTVYSGTLAFNDKDIIDIVAKKFSSNKYHRGYEGDIYDEAYSELKILSHLMNEKRIINVYGFTYSKCCDGSLKIYILMEKLNTNGDLQDCIREPHFWKECDGERYYSMSERIKRDICIKMCECVQDLHKNQIVHCDLKPNNMIYYTDKIHKEGSSFYPEKRIKLIDFGSSIQMDSNSKSEMTECDCDMGTEGYMAPELKDGLACYKSDIYSLAVSILEIWSGDIWLDGESESFAECRRDVLRSLREVKDKNLTNILQRCLISDMKKRPPISSIITALNTS